MKIKTKLLKAKYIVEIENLKNWLNGRLNTLKRELKDWKIDMKKLTRIKYRRKNRKYERAIKRQEYKEKLLLLVYSKSQKKNRMNKRKAVFVELTLNEKIIIFQT